LPGLYRVHERPEQEKLAHLGNILAQYGVSLDTGKQAITARDYQKVLDQIRTKPYAQALQLLVLRSMNQAIYSEENQGHFGLNYGAYAHFTSPIRRLPDLINHRLIKHMIASDCVNPHLRRVDRPASDKAYPYDLTSMAALALAASQTERKAEGAVYEVLEWLKCEYLKQFLGEDFAGRVTSVTKFGVFVELDQLFVEGLVAVDTLAGGYYRFDADSQRLYSERAGVSFRLGDAVMVHIADISSEQGRINLELLSHEPLARSDPKARKPRKHHDFPGPAGAKSRGRKKKRKG